ncbi:unnamed protein product, partial [Brenthis ino]
MSSIEEDFITVPWVGFNSHKKCLSIAVLSTNGDFIENLSEALIHIHAKSNYRWKLIVLRSHSLEEIVRQAEITGKVAIDFIIIAMDTSRIFCIEWARKVLEQVHPDLRIRRVVMVNASGLPVNAMAVNASDIITFCSENRIEMLNANISKTDDAQFVSRRILKYIEVSVGSESGIPNLNI